MPPESQSQSHFSRFNVKFFTIKKWVGQISKLYKATCSLLSVKFCFTAGDHIIIVQPSPSAATDKPGKVMTSSGSVHLSSADCCSVPLYFSGSA